MYIHINFYLYIYLSIYLSIYVYTYICLHMYVYVYKYMYIYMFIARHQQTLWDDASVSVLLDQLLPVLWSWRFRV